uniref:OmpP1/FadL family transporter n=1 Tax=Prevotella sp. TaxID=59823 RepID=UPI00402A0FA1
MNTKNLFFALLASMTALTATAQETYQDTKLIGNDLNGTARYVGMGGAMEALGADISTMASNPAGTGFFSRTQVSVTGGLVWQNGVESHSVNGGHKTNASFDQIGIVAPLKINGKPCLNVGFNYHKSRNFDQILTASGALSMASQNKLSAIKYDKVGEWGWNAIDANYKKILEKTDDQGKKYMDYYNGQAFDFGQYQHGYIGVYDFNISGAVSNNFYLGVTAGLHDVNYRSSSTYFEQLEQNTNGASAERLKIDGTGVDVKVGAIFLPVDGSPFRVGLYINSPVFYDLKLRGDAGSGFVQYSGNLSDNNSSAYIRNSCNYEYKIYTPWKFGVSLGHTVGSYLALGATYEYSDYGSIDNRVIDGTYYDPWYGDAYDTSSSDDVMNAHTERTLKGVHTLKLGAEFKPLPTLALRAGYNWVSAVFDENGFRDGSLESPGSGYATSTDYTNWKATNRFTLGLGFQASKHHNLDLAYQYSHTNGDFYPFMSYYGDTNPENNCIVRATKVSHDRNQVMATLSYRF